jgi:hypothetical protein
MIKLFRSGHGDLVHRDKELLVGPLSLDGLHIWRGADRMYLRMGGVLQGHNELDGLAPIPNRDTQRIGLQLCLSDRRRRVILRRVGAAQLPIIVQRNPRWSNSPGDPRTILNQNHRGEALSLEHPMPRPGEALRGVSGSRSFLQAHCTREDRARAK